ncbi:MAG: hypothetical protein ACPH5G_14995 [Pseudooceanicola atlanticus]
MRETAGFSTTTGSTYAFARAMRVRHVDPPCLIDCISSAACHKMAQPAADP